MDADKTNTLPILLFFCIVSIGLHLPSFTVEHRAGDEVVYRGLAGEMGWDLSHYTTMDNPRLNSFPFPLYRAPLFVHPPLLPFILKLANAVADATALVLGWLTASMCLLLLFIRRTLLSFGAGRGAVTWGLALATFCPVLLLTTSKLLGDGVLAIYLFCGISLAIEAFRGNSARRMLVAGLLLAVGFNAKFSALVGLPIVLGLQAFYLYEQAAKSDEGAVSPGGTFRVMAVASNWRLFLVLMAPVLSLGMQHFYRFALEYHTLSPLWLVEWDDWGALNRFSRMIASRTRLHMLVYLISLFPLLLMVCSPGFYRVASKLFRERRWEFIYIAAFIYLFCCLLAFQHQEMRYLAALFPFLYVSAALVWQYGNEVFAKRLAYLLALSLTMLVMGASVASFRHPTRILVIPPVFEFVPGLTKFYALRPRDHPSQGQRPHGGAHPPRTHNYKLP